MTLYEAENAARCLADELRRAVAIYHLTREDEYNVRAADAPGGELLRVYRTVHPRRVSTDAPTQIELH